MDSRQLDAFRTRVHKLALEIEKWPSVELIGDLIAETKRSDIIAEPALAPHLDQLREAAERFLRQGADFKSCTYQLRDAVARLERPRPW